MFVFVYVLPAQHPVQAELKLEAEARGQRESTAQHITSHRTPHRGAEREKAGRRGPEGRLEGCRRLIRVYIYTMAPPQGGSNDFLWIGGGEEWVM